MTGARFTSFWMYLVGKGLCIMVKLIMKLPDNFKIGDAEKYLYSVFAGHSYLQHGGCSRIEDEDLQLLTYVISERGSWKMALASCTIGFLDEKWDSLILVVMNSLVTIRLTLVLFQMLAQRWK